jgi:acetylornithine deacetylase
VKDSGAEALPTLDPAAIARDAAAVVRVPSPTGDERAALEALAELAAAHGLEPDLHQHDLTLLRAKSDHPGEEAPRDELWGLTVTLPGSAPGRIALNGHVDVVGLGTVPWRHAPGTVVDDRLYGRGAVDMKGAVVAALHALAAVRAAGVAIPEVVLQCVASEEDGGLGTFAELERDAAFDAALIPEPTGFDVVCAQAGALTFRLVVPGRSAHAAQRLEGCSAIDRYVRVHAALQALEAHVNTDVEHPLMRELALPYPLLVGRVSGGDWSSQVPDRLEAEGRLGVAVGADAAAARALLEATVAGALDDGEAPAEVHWTGGAYLPAQTAADHPWARLVAGAVAAERGRLGSRACPGAPTCACSARAGSRA